MTRPAQRSRLLRSSLVCLLLITTVVSVAGLGTASAQPTQQVPPRGLANHLVINEVYDSQNVALEYFELYNPLATTINLSTYVIYNHDGNTPLSNLDNPSIAGGQLLPADSRNQFPVAPAYFNVGLRGRLHHC